MTNGKVLRKSSIFFFSFHHREHVGNHKTQLSQIEIENSQKMKIITAASILASASAFAPVQQGRTEIRLNMWGEPTKKEGESDDMSKALPFAPRPKLLDGTLAGDVGFE